MIQHINNQTYQINEIEKFVLIMKDQKYLFKIHLKGGNFIDICTFCSQTKDILNSFIYLINGQIIIKSYNNNIPPANIPTLQ